MKEFEFFLSQLTKKQRSLVAGLKNISEVEASKKLPYEIREIAIEMRVEKWENNGC